MSNKKILISIIIVTYNSKNHIKNCLESILNQSYPANYDFEIVIVDNCSSDETVSFIEDNYPARIIKNQVNSGYGSANNLGVKNSEGNYIVILNPDTICDEGWLPGLIEPLKNHSKLITTPRVLVYDGKYINSCGLITHFTGLSFTRGLNAQKDDFNRSECINGIFGCCFAIKKKDFLKLGGFDPDIFLYTEDVELSYRAHLNDFKILFVHNSIIKHDYVLNVSPQKIYYLERGRYHILKKYMPWKYFLVLLPSLLIAEVLITGYALKYGFEGLKYKIKALRDVLSLEADKIDGNEIKIDKIFRFMDTEIPLDQLTFNPVERAFKIIANKIFTINWVLFKSLNKNASSNKLSVDRLVDEFKGDVN
ncbi:MAG TPA: glycosyltransferase family 2 protein [Methanobacteriaceae archaeon]|nr:glycosyltransferase family 2 protein [Methanobacteriaceae archaeon]